MCIFGTIYGIKWEKAYEADIDAYIITTHEPKDIRALISQALTRLGTWILINMNLIPIAMIATLESVKLA